MLFTSNALITFREAVQSNQSLICRLMSSSTGGAGFNGLTQGHLHHTPRVQGWNHQLSDGPILFFSPRRFYCMKSERADEQRGRRTLECLPLFHPPLTSGQSSSWRRLVAGLSTLTNPTCTC